MGDVAKFTALFDEHCREHGHDASLRAFEQQVPHRERARHAIMARDPGFCVMGVPVLSIEVPADRALRVTAVPGDHGWRSMRIEFSDALVADSWVFWQLGADNARFAFDFRPHSHHWQVMRLVRASEHETGVIEVGGAAILMAMTSVGDGYFPVHLDVDAAAMPVALRIDIAGED